MPIVTVRHLTRYRYRQPVEFGEHRIMFRPREAHDQRILSENLIVTPRPLSLRFVHDLFGNCVGIARFDTAADTLTFESAVEVDHRPVPLSEHEAHADEASAIFPVLYGPEDRPDLIRSIERQHPDPNGQLKRWAQGFATSPGMRVLDLLSTMTRTIHHDFAYAGRLEGGTQTPLETLKLGSGACRDFATLLIEAARSLNLAARFVSGYVYRSARGGRERVGGGHTHAWASVYLPHCGWVDFDPTNGIVGSQDLIRVGVARESRQAMPLTGTWDGDAGDYLGMDVEVTARMHRPPARLRRVA